MKRIIIDWNAVVATLETFGIVLLVFFIAFALVMVGVQLAKAGLYWAVGLEACFAFLLMFLFVYYQFKGIGDE